MAGLGRQVPTYLSRNGFRATSTCRRGAAFASQASHWVRIDAGWPQTRELICILLADCADSHTGTACCWYPHLSQRRPPHSLLSCHCIFAPAFSTARARFWRPGGHRTQSPASTTQAHTDGARPESVDGPASPVIAALPGLPAHQPPPITARHPLCFSRRHTRPPSFDIDMAFCLSSPAPPSLFDPVSRATQDRDRLADGSWRGPRRDGGPRSWPPLSRWDGAGSRNSG